MNAGNDEAEVRKFWNQSCDSLCRVGDTMQPLEIQSKSVLKVVLAERVESVENGV